jgi:tetratricopeptide (TPR) repeat protein
VLFQHGLTYHQQGQLEKAKQLYEQVLAKQPQHFDALHLSGVIAYQTRNPHLAVELIGKAITINPNVAAFYSNRGTALKELKRLDEALASYDKAIAIKPDFADAYSNRGNALQELKRLDEALASYDKAIAIKPDFADAYSNRGTALKELKRLDEALASYDKAIAIKPDFTDAYSNRGTALKELKRLDEALASYDKAIAIKPDYADAYLNKSLALLLNGHFMQGLTLYEWRWKTEGLTSHRNFSQPLWLGVEDLSNKTILLHAEQGLGDTIQFCRYAKLVKARNARVIMEVPSALIGLLKGLDGVDEWVEKGKSLPEFDYHCPLLSLPLAFQTNTETIPNQTPYLSFDEKRFIKWQKYIGTNGFRVAIAWQGSTGKVDVGRSFPLRMFKNISEIEGVRLISLQKGSGVEQLQQLPQGMQVETLGEDFDTGEYAFLDSAAVMRCVDLVITSDTALTHLAGGLGIETWLVLKQVPDWRWMMDRKDCPWYSKHRLYRQKDREDWRSVFVEVEADLDSLVARKNQSFANKSTTLPHVPVSWGELIDKITILEIKKSRIESSSAQVNITRELKYLSQILTDQGAIFASTATLKDTLKNINEELWKIEDEIREKDAKKEFDSDFIYLARSVYTLNDQRARIKRQINEELDSELMEEKSYKSFCM